MAESNVPNNFNKAPATAGSVPRYIPHLIEPAVLNMGLSRMSHWLDAETDLAHWAKHKRACRAAWGERVYQILPEAVDASVEFAELIAVQANTAIRTEQLRECALEERLWQASLSVPEDLVVMLPGTPSYRLMAASLCSPSHWRLEEKIGKPLRAVHDPIPDIHLALSDRIDRFFDHIKPDHPVERFNWSVQRGDALHALPVHEVLDEQAGDQLFYRVERQTLLRLPQTGAVAFTIRVYLDPLESLLNVPGAMPALLTAIENTPPPLAHYKGFDVMAPLLKRYRSKVD